MADTSGLALFNTAALTAGGSTNSLTINASTTKVGAVFLTPKAGNIRYVGYVNAGFSGSGTVDCRVETVASFLPTGTLFGTNTNANHAPSVANTFQWIQLTADAAVAAGDLVAAVIGYVSGTSVTVRWNAAPLMAAQHLLPYPLSMPSGTWAAATGVPMIGLKYDDNTIVRGGLFADAQSVSNLQSGTNPNEYATVFTAPFSCTLIGARTILTMASGAACTINLYEGASTTPVSGGTITIDAGEYRAAASGVVLGVFAAPITLTSGQAYRLSVKATAAANVGVSLWPFPSSAERNVCVGECSSDSRNNASWIGESANRVVMITPVLGTVDAAGGGGPLIAGRLVK